MTKSARSQTNDDRHKVLHNYHDHVQVKFPLDVDAPCQHNGERRKGPRGGVTVPFPTKLHAMLSKVEDDGLSHIVSWQPHGRCFVVHKPKEFVSEVMPTYFRQSKLTSFQRQLNLYGFARITTGRDRGGYYHELFMKHRLFLCQKMTRIRIKGTGIKGKASPETEPDFYSMPWVELDDASADMNFHLECEVAAALEEESRRLEPDEQPAESMGRGKGSKKKKILGKSLDEVSPQNASVIAAPVPVTPDGAKEQLSLHLSVPSDCSDIKNELSQSSNIGEDMQNLFDLCLPLLSSDSEEASNDEPLGGEQVSFEGQHFHYLNSFAVKAQPSSFTLAPRKKVDPFTSATPRSLAHMLSNLSESSLSVAQSLHEPILTPSCSSSSLSMMIQRGESLEINPETIFSDQVFGDEWEIGRDGNDFGSEVNNLSEV